MDIVEFLTGCQGWRAVPDKRRFVDDSAAATSQSLQARSKERGCPKGSKRQLWKIFRSQTKKRPNGTGWKPKGRFRAVAIMTQIEVRA